MRKQTKLTKALHLYKQAERHVTAAGYGWEIAWQRKRAEVDYTERDLLRETAWVVLCSGFRETSVRKCFGYISLCFCDWEGSVEIAERAEICVETALARFNNRRKLQGIATAARLVAEEGFTTAKQRINQDPINQLQVFPYIGPITSWHLAKNLGFPVAKNDRHLARLANMIGFGDAHELCDAIAAATSEAVAVIDVILWRYATLRPMALAA